MLTTPPWSRLPLTVRWLKQEYEVYFPPDRPPPTHMPVAYGPVEICKGRGGRGGGGGGVSTCKSSCSIVGSQERARGEEVEEVVVVEKEVEEVMMEDEFLKCTLCSVENQVSII